MFGADKEMGGKELNEGSQPFAIHRLNIRPVSNILSVELSINLRPTQLYRLKLSIVTFVTFKTLICASEAANPLVILSSNRNPMGVLQGFADLHLCPECYHNQGRH